MAETPKPQNPKPAAANTVPAPGKSPADIRADVPEENAERSRNTNATIAEDAGRLLRKLMLRTDVRVSESEAAQDAFLMGLMRLSRLR